MADAGLDAQLAAFRIQFLARLDGTLAALDAQLRGQGAAVPTAVLQEVHAQLHKLAGAGGTFGFPGLSRQARTLELQAQAWLDAGGAIPAADWEAWKSAVSGLRQAVNTADDDTKGPVADSS